MSTHQLIQELKQSGITHPEVLKAIASVPREDFVLSRLKNKAYENVALPIDKEQTISQPYVVALMTQALFNHPHPQKILEIGTGSGYQAAILATLFKEIWTIERIEALYVKAKHILQKLKYANVHCEWADGTQGWLKNAPYDGIIVTAATTTVPPALLEQLNPKGGVLVIPLGTIDEVQRLTLIKRHDNHFEKSILEQVIFVPLLSNTQRK